MPLLKKKDKFRTELVDVHPAAQIIFHIGETIRQGEGQLGDGIGTRFGNMVTADGYGIEIPHLVVNEILLQPMSANSVLKMQVFCTWSSFRISACTVPRTCVRVQALISS